MEIKKYYTPTIEEFHVGFEYEKLWYDDSWSKEILEEWEIYAPNLGPRESGSSSLEDIFDYLKHNNIRVKYLDKEDIESLGWKLGILRLFNKELTVFGSEKYPNYVLTTPIEVYEKTHIIDISRVESIGKGLSRVFRGTIKNKSELKRLMKQLSINE